jgi:hypothetical protein
MRKVYRRTFAMATGFNAGLIRFFFSLHFTAGGHSTYIPMVIFSPNLLITKYLWYECYDIIYVAFALIQIPAYVLLFFSLRDYFNAGVIKSIFLVFAFHAIPLLIVIIFMRAVNSPLK